MSHGLINCHEDCFMTACLILAIQGTSAAQAIPAEDSIKQQPVLIPEAVFQPDPMTVQQQFKEGPVTSASKNPKKLGKRRISGSTAEHGTICPFLLLFCLWHNK